MALYRVQSSIESTSGLARDRCQNVLHFEGLGTEQTDLLGIVEWMNTFWTETHNGSNVGRLLSDQMVPELTYAIYRVGDPPPQVPIFLGSLTLDIVATLSLPRRMSLVLSHGGTPASGLNMSRRRGRMFVGAVHQGTGQELLGDFRPTPATQALLLAAIAAAQEAAEQIDVQLGVYSDGARDNSDPSIPYLERPLLPSIFTTSTRASVANIFGSQRRRGLALTSRAQQGI